MISSCVKVKVNPTPTQTVPVLHTKTIDCPEMYNIRSKAYVNPYQGTLQTGSLITPENIFPDRFSYWHPSINPNNEFEFCYLRRENGIQQDDDMDLFSFNICNGKTKLITKHVAYGPNWSVKNWIIFTGGDRELWKIKENGDSLTQLTHSGSYQSWAKWCPDGSKYIWNGMKVADENGNYLFDLPYHYTSFFWKNNDEIICEDQSQKLDQPLVVFIQNIKTRIKEELISIPTSGPGRLESFNHDTLYISVFNTDKSLSLKYYAYNLNTKDTTFIIKRPFSFVQSYGGSSGDRIILQQFLTDTKTGSINYLNFRSHLALMNFDGKNVRLIMIPE